MKKTALLAVALATCLGYVPAHAADVVSSNIVGYEKITITPGLNMIGNQFLAVGGNSFQNINEMFKGDDGFVAGGGADEADTILTWNGSAYDNIYYYDNYSEPYEWYNVEDVDNATTDVVTTGQGFWLKHLGTTTITATLAGEVPMDATITVALTPGLNFVSNPYPMAICPNGGNFTIEGAVAGGGADEADTILTWNGSAYDNIYYYDNYSEPYEWYNVEDVDNAVSESILKPAMGFWYKHLGNENATLTFSKPY